MARLLMMPSAPTSAQLYKALTPREAEVASMVAMRNKRIAYELGISPITVRAHVSSAMYKLGAETRTELAIKFLANQTAAKIAA